MHSVVDCALHRVGDARAPGGTRVSRKHLARGGCIARTVVATFKSQPFVAFGHKAL
jgi:hypothetical protein